MRIKSDSFFEEVSAKIPKEKQTNIVMIQIRNIIISLTIRDRKFYGFFRPLFPLLHDLELEELEYLKISNVDICLWILLEFFSDLLTLRRVFHSRILKSYLQNNLRKNLPDEKVFYIKPRPFF